MKAISPLNPSFRSPKLTTLTALAAACAMMLSAPVNAADTGSTTTNSSVDTSTAAPSAIDSSRRVIRRAQPNATVNPVQTDLSSDTASVPQNRTIPSTVTVQPMGMMSSNSTSMNTMQQAPLAQPQTPTRVPETRVYQRGPMTSTGIDLSGGQLPNIPTPTVQLSAVSFIPTILIAQQQGLGTDKLDVSLIDDFIADVSPNARHYPPNFPNRSQRHYTREKIKVLAEWIEPYATSPNASYDVLIRAAKLNGMGRNLDLGSDYTVRGGQYVDRAIKIKSDSGEANFLYGMMLSEGGGFKEGQKYLDRAVSLGYTEAEQSLAQSDLLSDRRSNALERLRRLEQQVPDNTIIRQQIKLIEEGKFYIWDLPAPDINIKPTA